ncbi:MAG: hypothetical protein WCH13_07330 [Deltaproteobacteria bacterium]
MRPRHGGTPGIVRGIALLLLLLAGPAVRAADALCSPSPTRLCLLGGRFSATLRWDDGSGAHDALVAAPRADAGGSASGLFYFYGSDPSNWEVLVKMIDGCRTNGRYWLLVSASTGFEWRLEVVDEAKTIGRAWFHPLDGNASGVADFAAFRGCPAQGLPPSLRYRNDLACGSTPFLSVLSAGARAWESSSGVASPAQDVEESPIGPFVESNESACGGIEYPGAFPLVRDRRYLLLQTLDDAGARVLRLFDEGSILEAAAAATTTVAAGAPRAGVADAEGTDTRRERRPVAEVAAAFTDPRLRVAR